MTEGTSSRAWLESAAMAAAGVATFAAGLWLVEDDSQARAFVEAIGAAAVILAPFAPRLEAFSLGLRGVEARLASRPAGRALLEAAIEATDETLLAVLPLLDEDVGVEILRLPSTAASLKLVDDDLVFLRKELHVEIVAIRPQGAERWTAGGQVSRIELQPGTELLALGARGDLDAARARLAFAGVSGPNHVSSEEGPAGAAASTRPAGRGTPNLGE